MIRRISRRSVVTAAVFLASIVPTVPAVAAPEGPAECKMEGSLTTNPSITYDPIEGSYTLKGIVDCASAGKGTLTGEGTGTITCSVGSSRAVLHIAWQDGDTSKLEADLTNVFYSVFGSGSVTEGALQGKSVELAWFWQSPGAANRCAVGGVLAYDYTGTADFKS